MIRLFVSDIDGCLSTPFQPFDLPKLGEIAALASVGSVQGVPENPPAFSICSGRGFGYVEAMSQLLGLRQPVLFESGGGLFDPVSGQTVWHPALTPAIQRALGEIRAWLAGTISGTALSIDLGKRTQAGIIGPNTREVTDRVSEVRAYVSERYPGFTVAYTPFSIDVLADSLMKHEGMRWLAGEAGLDLSEVAFIGDTEGDLGALRLVGRSFAPDNAAGEVKAAVDVVTYGTVADGVLEAYRACISANRRAA